MGKGVFGTALSQVFKWVKGSTVRLTTEELLPLVGGFEAPHGNINFEDGGFTKTARLIDRALHMLQDHRRKLDPDVDFDAFVKKVENFARLVQMNNASKIGHLEGVEVHATDFNDILKGRPFLDQAINNLLERTMGGNRKTCHKALALGAFRQGLLKIAADHPDVLAFDNNEAAQATTKRLLIALPDTSAPAKTLEEYKTKLETFRGNLEQLRRRDLVRPREISGM